MENIKKNTTQNINSSPESFLFDSSIDDQFIKYKPFKHKTEKTKDKVIKKNKIKIQNSDLNYFDELSFGDALKKFSPESVNKPRTVYPSPNPILELDRTELHEIDQQYIVSADINLTETVPVLDTSNIPNVSPVSSQYPAPSIPEDLGRYY